MILVEIPVYILFSFFLIDISDFEYYCLSTFKYIFQSKCSKLFYLVTAVKWEELLSMLRAVPAPDSKE